MKTFKVNFRPFDEISPNHVVTVHAEHEDDIDVYALGYNMDPAIYNSADWYISTPGAVVLKNSPDTTIDIWR